MDTGGKDGDDIIRITMYLIEYQKIKIPLLSEYMFHFLGEILVAVTGEIRNWLLVL